MLRSGVELPFASSTLCIARNPTFALSITADCQIHPGNISFVKHNRTDDAYGSDRSHPVILQVANEVSPAIIIDLLINPDPTELLEIDWRREEKHPRENFEPEGAFFVPIFIDTSVRVELCITLSVETHEALSTYQDIILELGTCVYIRRRT